MFEMVLLHFGTHPSSNFHPRKINQNFTAAITTLGFSVVESRITVLKLLTEILAPAPVGTYQASENQGYSFHPAVTSFSPPVCHPHSSIHIQPSLGQFRETLVPTCGRSAFSAFLDTESSGETANEWLENATKGFRDFEGRVKHEQVLGIDCFSAC